MKKLKLYKEELWFPLGVTVWVSFNEIKVVGNWWKLHHLIVPRLNNIINTIYRSFWWVGREIK